METKIKDEAFFKAIFSLIGNIGIETNEKTIKGILSHLPERIFFIIHSANYIEYAFQYDPSTLPSYCEVKEVDKKTLGKIIRSVAKLAIK